MELCLQVPDPSTGYLTTRQVREFLDTDNDGLVETMVVHLTIKNNPGATSQLKTVRIFSAFAPFTVRKQLT